jgi:hypothetical protein
MSHAHQGPTGAPSSGPRKPLKWSRERRGKPAKFEASALTNHIHDVPRKDISTLQIRGLFMFVATGLLALAGCAEAPIAKTNCWATAPQTTVSSMGTVSRSANSPSTLPAGPDDAADCE